MLRKRVGLPDMPHPLLKTKPKEVAPSIAKEDVEELPQDIFTKQVNLREGNINIETKDLVINTIFV